MYKLIKNLDIECTRIKISDSSRQQLPGKIYDISYLNELV